MPVNFYFSDKLDILADRLNSNIGIEPETSKTLFHQPLVIIPNRNLRRWIELYISQLAKTNEAIIANWKFEFLESFLIKLYKNKYPDKSYRSQTDILVDIFMLFDQSGENEYTLFKSYYGTSRESSGMGEKNLKLELAQKLVSLFEEYERHRHDMILSWISNDDSDKKYLRMAEKQNLKPQYLAQKYLYVKLFEIQNKNSFILRDFLDENAIDDFGNSRQHIHVFGLSQISRLHLEILGRLEKHYHIHYYIFFLIHPEIPKNQSPSKWNRFYNIPENSKENYPGEYLKGACEMFDLFQSINPQAKFYYKYSKPKCETRLDFAKCKILGINHPQSIESFESDESIQLLAAPTKRLEIELIYNSILNELNADPELKLNEIAILIPNINDYRTTIEMVFESGVGRSENYFHLPYNLVDFSSGNLSFFFNAMITLSGIFIDQQLTRDKFLQLLDNPCFNPAFESPEMIINWRRWINELNLYNGSEFDHCFQTWNHGIKRLILGSVMRNVKGEYKHDYKDILPYQAGSIEKYNHLNQFINFVNSIENSINLISKKNLKPKELIDELINQSDKYITVPAHMLNEFSVKNTINQLLHDLKNQKNINNTTLDLEYIYLILKKLNATVTGNSGQYLVDGITISSLQTMRPVPFKIIYIPGLDADSFPGKNDSSLMNLRNMNHQTGDIQLIEKNTMLFLESVFSVSNKIFPGFQSMEMNKDRKRLLSAVVDEFFQFSGYENSSTNHIIQDTPVDSIKTKVEKNHINYFEPFHSDYRSDDFEKSFGYLSKFSIYKGHFTIDSKNFSRFLREPAIGILDTRYNIKFPYLRQKSIDQEKPLFTPYVFNDVIQAGINRFFEMYLNKMHVTAKEIIHTVYNEHELSGNSPGRLYRNIDFNHLEKTFIEIYNLCNGWIKKDIHLYTQKSYSNSPDKIKIKDYLIHYRLNLDYFQYSKNNLSLLETRSGTADMKTFVHMYVQGLLFYFMQPEEFEFDFKKDYYFECNLIFKKGNDYQIKTVRFRISNDSLIDYLTNQLQILFADTPDCLNLELLLGIDKSLQFKDFSSSNELNKELLQVHQYHTDPQNEIPDWKILLPPEFTKDSLKIIASRWNHFSKAYYEKN